MSSARKIKRVGLLVVSALVALTLLQVAQAADGTPPANTTVSDVPTSAPVLKKYDCTPTGPVCFLIISDAAGKDATGDSALHTDLVCGAPEIASYPVLSGTGSPGNTLSLSDGTWRSACSWINIISYDWNGPHGSGNTYAVGDSDVGSTIVGTVSACNDEGCTPAPSNGITITGPSEPPAPPPAPSITLTYSPAQPNTGEATVLSLTSNAQRCNAGTLTGGRSWNTSGVANGNFSLGILPAGNYTAQIDCVTSQNVWGSRSVSFTVSATQCSNGIDDDGDGKVDYPNDPGCSSSSDTSESPDPTPPPTASQCSNGIDDDGDGKVDYPNDPGCSSSSDTSESPDPVTTGETDPCFDGAQPGGPMCELAVGSGASSETTDYFGCGITVSCLLYSHCANFKFDTTVQGKLPTGTTYGYYDAFKPHIQFYYCVVWGKTITKVTGALATNTWKRYPWVYDGFTYTSAGIGSSVGRMTFDMVYRQCVSFGAGCFDTRHVVFEFTINANTADRSHPVKLSSFSVD
jgi:hypothetical protein